MQYIGMSSGDVQSSSKLELYVMYVTERETAKECNATMTKASERLCFYIVVLARTFFFLFLGVVPTAFDLSAFLMLDLTSCIFSPSNFHPQTARMRSNASCINQ